MNAYEAAAMTRRLPRQEIDPVEAIRQIILASTGHTAGIPRVNSSPVDLAAALKAAMGAAPAGGGGPVVPMVDPRDPRYGIVNPRTGLGGGFAHAYGTAVPGLGIDVSLSGTRGVASAINPALAGMFKYDVGGQGRGLTQDDWVRRPGDWFISGEGDHYGITPDPYD